MKYKNIIEGIFIEKKNRFIALVDIKGKKEEVHIKNTGKLANLLIKGRKCYLQDCMNPKRKTRYDLISIVDSLLEIVNIDSQANNKIMKEWLEKQDYDIIQAEYSLGNSRFDFYMEKDDKKYYLEVKGCTLQKDGIGLFPDAISLRASKHVQELIELKKQGYHCIIAFVIGMPKIKKVEASDIDLHFKEVFQLAKKEGIEIWYMETSTSENEYKIVQKNR